MAKNKFRRFEIRKPSREFYLVLTLGITVLALAAGGFFYYQYLVRQIHQLPLYDFQFPQETKTLPPIPVTITETPFQRPLLGSSFTELFSGTGWLDTEKTTLYQDFFMTQLSFPPKFEWQSVPDAEPQMFGDSIFKHFVRLQEDGTDRRCIDNKCLIQRGLDLEVQLPSGLKKISLPAELNALNLLNISIGASDKFWLVGAVIKEAGQYRGSVYKFDGQEFTKIFNENDFLSPYPGVFGFGGTSDNWLAIYGAYEGNAWQAKTVKDVMYFNNISRFFPIRAMGDSVKLAEAKERFVSFQPAAIRDGKNWYIYSLTEGKPKFIKLIEDDEGKISAAWDLTKNLGLDQGVENAVFALEKPGSLLALIERQNKKSAFEADSSESRYDTRNSGLVPTVSIAGAGILSSTFPVDNFLLSRGPAGNRTPEIQVPTLISYHTGPTTNLAYQTILSIASNTEQELRRFTDLGFDKSQPREAVSVNINNLPGEVVSAAISEFDLTMFGDSISKHALWVSNDGREWYGVELKHTFKFPKAGNKIFWKASFAPDQDPATSPVLNRLQLEYQVRL